MDFTAKRPLPAVPPGNRTRAERLQHQSSLPVTLRTGGRRFAALYEHIDPAVGTMALADLEDGHWRRITRKRIEMQQSYSLYHMNVGLIGKSRVIEAVRRGTELGQTVVRVEKAHIERLLSSPPRR